MRGDFEAYLNDSFRDENGKLNLASLLALEDEADMDVGRYHAEHPTAPTKR